MLGGWGEFIAAFVVFLLSHVIPARPKLRAALGGALGERGFVAIYSLVSLGLLYWLILAAGRAPYIEIWSFARWQMTAPNVVMPFVALLAAFGVGAANPLSFGGNPRLAFDPDHPGIAGVARHPILAALGLWAAAHLVPNGDLAHGLLFGVFVVMATAGMIAIDRRNQRKFGEAEWRRLAARTSLIPLSALVSGRWQPTVRFDVKRLLIAAIAWLALLVLHQPVIGVSPLP